MIKLTDEQISDIAQELEIGMICFVHKKTGEMKSYPDEMPKLKYIKSRSAKKLGLYEMNTHIAIV